MLRAPLTWHLPLVAHAALLLLAVFVAAESGEVSGWVACGALVGSAVVVASSGVKVSSNRLSVRRYGRVRSVDRGQIRAIVQEPAESFLSGEGDQPWKQIVLELHSDKKVTTPLVGSYSQCLRWRAMLDSGRQPGA